MFMKVYGLKSRLEVILQLFLYMRKPARKIEITQIKHSK